MLETLARNIEKNRSKLIAGLAIALVAGGVILPGCVAARDGVARALGLPTSEEIEPIRAERDEALAELDRAAEREAEAQAARDAAAAKAARAQAQREALAEQYAQLTDALAEAVRQNAASLVSAYEAAVERVRVQMAAIDDERASLRAAIDRADAVIASAARGREAAAESVQQLDAELAAVETYVAERLAGVEGFVRQAGAQLTAWGVPGAAPVADGAADLVGPGGLLGGALLGAYGGIAARKRGKERKAMAEVIAANDVSGVVSRDERARETAKALQSPAARKVFNELRTEAEQIAERMRRSARTASPPVTGGE